VSNFKYNIGKRFAKLVFI